jgi:dihydrofolate reductase
MRTLQVFETISVDGFFTDAAADMSWAHRHDPEWDAFVSGNASGDGALLFGRVTYDQMAAFWPTPQAAQMLPEVAAGINAMPKYVASRTMREATWRNTAVLEGDLVAAVRALKDQPGAGITILGSGSVVSQLAEARLVDEYQLVVSPTILGRGRTLFETVTSRQDLRLTRSRTFTNGNVVLWYAPA